MTRVLLLALALAACDGPTISGTTCEGDKDCNLFNAQGTCESTGFCSFPDATCTSGRRFGDVSGKYTQQCVGDLGDASIDGGVNATATFTSHWDETPRWR